ncbi:MAG TPA: TIM barrel protein, partial [Planctomycetaceae bacterium]
GDHVGVTLALTTGREAPGVLADALKAVTAGPVGVNLDPAASVMAGHDPAALARELHPYLRHVRVRDGLREADGAGVEVPVGRGEVDWESVFASLAEAEYAGWFTPDRTTGDDPARDAAKALAFVTNVMPF